MQDSVFLSFEFPAAGRFRTCHEEVRPVPA